MKLKRQPEASSRENASAYLERLRLITLALEASIREGDYAATAALFEERSSLIARIASSAPNATHASALAAAEREGRRLLCLVQHWRSEALAQIETGRTGRRAAQAYRDKEPNLGIDSRH
jgi:hypothetical protein